MPSVADVLDVARSQVGYQETPINRTRYGQAFGMDGVSWCAIFVWWIFDQARSPLPVKTASCAVLVSAFRQQGRFSTKPQPGDVGFCGSQGQDHAFLVEAVGPDGVTVTTIEGNSNTDGSYNGIEVCRRTRRMGDGRVYGFGHPTFSSAPTPEPEEDSLPAYADRCQWNDGSVALVYPDGAVYCYGAKSWGSMLDLDPRFKQTFEQARSIRPVNPNDSQAGYRVGDKTEWTFDKNVNQYFKR